MVNSRNHALISHPQGQSVFASFAARGVRVLNSQVASQVLIIVAIIVSIILLTRV